MYSVHAFDFLSYLKVGYHDTTSNYISMYLLKMTLQYNHNTDIIPKKLSNNLASQCHLISLLHKSLVVREGGSQSCRIRMTWVEPISRTFSQPLYWWPDPRVCEV